MVVRRHAFGAVLVAGLGAVAALAALEFGCKGTKPLPPTSTPLPADSAAKLVEPGREPFVFVELFTSEGCSSCPHADTAINALVTGTKRRVFVVEWHVDYWDYLGWRDPYSSSYATERQQTYVASWETRSVYTPMTVVQGTEHHGGLARALDLAIASTLETAPTAGVTITPRDANATPLVVDYRTDGAADDAEVLFVVVERGVSSVVKRGENAGETLAHENVARAWARGNVGAAAIALGVPDAVKRDASSVIAVVFDRAKRPIAATEARLGAK